MVISENWCGCTTQKSNQAFFGSLFLYYQYSILNRISSSSSTYANKNCQATLARQPENQNIIYYYLSCSIMIFHSCNNFEIRFFAILWAKKRKLNKEEEKLSKVNLWFIFLSCIRPMCQNPVPRIVFLYFFLLSYNRESRR